MSGEKSGEMGLQGIQMGIGGPPLGLLGGGGYRKPRPFRLQARPFHLRARRFHLGGRRFHLRGPRCRLYSRSVEGFWQTIAAPRSPPPPRRSIRGRPEVQAPSFQVQCPSLEADGGTSGVEVCTIEVPLPASQVQCPSLEVEARSSRAEHSTCGSASSDAEVRPSIRGVGGMR